MIDRRYFAGAAVLFVIGGLLSATVLAAAPAAPATATLQAVAPASVPAAGDPRLAQALAQHRGKAVVINFWASWCEPCREEMPALSRLATRWKGRRLVVLTVAVADNERLAAEFLRDLGAELPVLHDREQTISRAWGARVLPTTVVLDRRHRLVLRGRGAIDWDAPAIDKQLQALHK